MKYTIAILEVGINISNKNLIEVMYYSSSDGVLDPNLRAGFLSALESFTTEVFGDNINVVSMASFKLVCDCIMVVNPASEQSKEALLCYAIVEKETDADVVKDHLTKINTYFLNRFSLHAIFGKKPKFFKKFKPRIDEILGDLKLKTEDRFRSIF